MLAPDPRVAALTHAQALGEVDGILTREMLDGIDNFFRARLWGDLIKLPEQQRAKTLPYILRWAETAAKISGVEAINGGAAGPFSMAAPFCFDCGFASSNVVVSPLASMTLLVIRRPPPWFPERPPWIVKPSIVGAMAEVSPNLPEIVTTAAVTVTISTLLPRARLALFAVAQIK